MRTKWNLFPACLLLLLLLMVPSARSASSDSCAVCNKRLGYSVYTVLDKVAHEKVFICPDCCLCPDECYVCGLPVKVDYLKLPDGRFLCARDGKTAILDEAKAREICEQVADSVDRLLARFTTFPTNTEVTLVDRVDLFDEFTVRGNDFECPEILGYIKSRTNQAGMKHVINMMSALPRAEFKATYAHEYTHAWVFENVPRERRLTLSRDAHEGFCELIAYLLMDSLREEGQKDRILRNSYTRGQINLFIEAEKKHGINDVLDWVRWGANPRLKAGNVADIRNVEMPRARPPSAPPAAISLTAKAPPAQAPDTLLLKGIASSKNQPLALINNQSFTVGESAKVQVGRSNVLVRCLAIGERSVRVQIVESGQELELHLPPVK
jgi:hypothetical protein